MEIIEKATDILEQISTFASLSLADIISSVFMQVVTFLVNLLLGL